MTESTTPSRGRPKKFDDEEVLNKILEAFWIHGYDALSTASLVQITGVNKPSLYAAFGSKEEIFEKVVNLYRDRFKTQVALKSLNKENLREALEAFFQQAIVFATNHKEAKGCLAIHGALKTKNNEKASQLLLQVRLDLEEVLYKRIKKAIKENDYNSDLKPKALAKYLTAVHSGLNIQVLNNATVTELRDVVKIALLNL